MGRGDVGYGRQGAKWRGEQQAIFMAADGTVF